MIETDGRPTIASRRADPLIEKALEKGRHLGDEVARVLLEDERLIFGTDLREALVSDDEALD